MACRAESRGLCTLLLVLACAGKLRRVWGLGDRWHRQSYGCHYWLTIHQQHWQIGEITCHGCMPHMLRHRRSVRKQYVRIGPYPTHLHASVCSRSRPRMPLRLRTLSLSSACVCFVRCAVQTGGGFAIQGSNSTTTIRDTTFAVSQSYACACQHTSAWAPSHR